MLRGKLGGWTWGPALAVAKPAILAVLSRIETGSLLLVDEPATETHVFGQKFPGKLNGHSTRTAPSRSASAVPRVELLVRNDAFWMRLFLFADMGFAEAYMLGDFDLNRDRMNNGTTAFSSIASAASSLARSTNTLSNSLLNISAHYDISNDMFAAFLSPDMTYSCPVWKPQTESDAHDESLEEAQIRKLVRFIDGAKIKSSDHVLEIGTGWGSFAIEAVRRTKCRVTSLTLSAEQKHLAENRIRAAGLDDQIEVLLMDYRQLPVPTTPYDKVVSIEMLEAVGQDFLATYFACVNRLLKKRGGIAMFQCITMPEGRHKAYSGSEDFINHYIFPGGYLPSITQILNHITQQSDGTLIVENVENIGGHYARTLRLWNEEFRRNFDAQIRPALLHEHPDMTEKAVDVFRRKWEYYFTYCEAGFLTKTLGDVIITVGREGAMELMEEIPL
ncbi:hypothetical protein CDD80_7317 [Ophiocordyceps camponoti-rufipedis]|uniref:Cyclopropane-fatty-acyl-phospholipid synthase n=1 Tax=Ophiocordyceps camponoti-rufipedis TaxID=2004952 RepID=A0A2C5ZE45_9HYPO|nr:hypothetical protein CDD80_7317 [Ophiocordyceps camponoti-rufipedis]